MGVVIRPAVVENIAGLAALNRIVQGMHVEAEPAHSKAEFDREEVEGFFRKLLILPNTFVFLAQVDDRLAGYVWFEVQARPSTPFNLARRRIYIHHIVASEDLRGTGVGSSLLYAVEAEARMQAVSQIALDTWAFNAGAQQFFQNLGFETFNIAIRKEIVDSAQGRKPA